MKAVLLSFILCSTSFAESHLTGVTLQMCDDQAHCLQISAPAADVSDNQSLFALPHPQVTGLGFDSKEISSAYVDFASRQIVLRERKNGSFFGEWSVHMDHFALAFFGR